MKLLGFIGESVQLLLTIGIRAEPAVLQFDWSRDSPRMDLRVLVYSDTNS